MIIYNILTEMKDEEVVGRTGGKKSTRYFRRTTEINKTHIQNKTKWRGQTPHGVLEVPRTIRRNLTEECKNFHRLRINRYQGQLGCTNVPKLP